MRELGRHYNSHSPFIVQSQWQEVASQKSTIISSSLAFRSEFVTGFCQWNSNGIIDMCHSLVLEADILLYSHSGSWWWTGRPGMLQSMGSQRVGHDWVTELNWFFSITFFLLQAGNYEQRLEDSKAGSREF